MRFSRSVREGPVRGVGGCGFGDGVGSFFEAHPLSSRVVASKTKPVRTFHYSLHAPRPGGMESLGSCECRTGKVIPCHRPCRQPPSDLSVCHSSRSPGGLRCRFVAARRRLASSLAALAARLGLVALRCFRTTSAAARICWSRPVTSSLL